MKQILTALIVALVLLISGCSDGTIEAQPIAEATAEVALEANVVEDPCENIMCDANSHCDNGNCVCDDNYKKCGNTCVSKDACCADAECAIGRICKDGKCTDTGCAYYQKYDYATKTCICSENTKFCAAQKKCIPKSSCCSHSDCDSSEECIPTQFLASVCIQKDKKMCRGIPESRRETFVITTDERYSIILQGVAQNGKMNLVVNDASILIANAETYNLGSNTTLFVDDLKTLGGYCKEY